MVTQQTSDELLIAVTLCEAVPYSPSDGWKNLGRFEIFGPLVFIGIVASDLRETELWLQALVEFSGPFVFYVLAHVIFAGLAPVINSNLVQSKLRGSQIKYPTIPYVALIALIYVNWLQLPFLLFGAGQEMAMSGYILSVVQATVIGELFMIYVVRMALPSIRGHNLQKGSGSIGQMGNAPNLGNTLVSRTSQSQDGKPAPPSNGAPPDTIIVIQGEVVDARKLIMLQASGNYVSIVEEDRQSLVAGPLFKVLNLIQGVEGVQVHRSSWIALSAAKAVEKDGEDAFLVTKSGERVKIARPRRREVFTKLALHGVHGAGP